MKNEPVKKVISMPDIRISDVFEIPLKVGFMKNSLEGDFLFIKLAVNYSENDISKNIGEFFHRQSEIDQLKTDKAELLKEQKRLQSMLYDALSCTGYFDAVEKGVYQIQPVRIYPQETKGK